MNFQQRFLILFADYRDMRDANTRLGDEVVQLRAALDQERLRSDALTERYMSREEKLNDKMLEARFGSRRLEPAASAAPSKPDFQTPQSWVAKQRATFMDQLKQREQLLNGSGKDQAHTN